MGDARSCWRALRGGGYVGGDQGEAGEIVCPAALPSRVVGTTRQRWVATVVAATNWRKGKQRGDMELFWSRVSLTPSWPVSFPPPAGTPLALMSVGSGLGAPTAKSASAGPKRTLGRPTRSKKGN
jgi:hypothetical protein